MSKGVSFGKNDEELIKLIEEYQHKNMLPSFVEAVRRLCKLAINFEKMREKND